MPGRLFGLSPGDMSGAEMALGIGLLTIGAMLGWEKFRPASLRLVPGALVGVVAATLVAALGGLEVTRVMVPSNILNAIDVPDSGLVAKLLDPSIYATALAIAFIASAETLLSAAAVDRMHDGVRTHYDKELRAQGVGNLLCGLVGALPMTGVIVRSSANVQAGAVSRLSTILHGTWILGFVALLPWLLREIPMAALGGILVVTGWRLVSLAHVTHLFHRYGVLPALIWAATLVTVVAEDLLTGVLVGLGLSLLELIPHMRRLGLGVRRREEGDETHLALDGAATFVTLPKLNHALDSIPHGKAVTVDVGRLRAIDHTSAEMLNDWLQRRRASGTRVAVSGGAGHLRGLAV